MTTLQWKGVQKAARAILNKKLSQLNTLTKKFKEFKPTPILIKEEIKVNPKIEYEMKKEKQNIEADVRYEVL